MVTETDFGCLADQLEGVVTFQEAFYAMDDKVSYVITDPASVQSAIITLNERVDAIAARFPGNAMVQILAETIKTDQRNDLLGMADEAKHGSRLNDRG